VPRIAEKTQSPTPASEMTRGRLRAPAFGQMEFWLSDFSSLKSGAYILIRIKLWLLTSVSYLTDDISARNVGAGAFRPAERSEA
jgi:hypothetical protein